MEMFSGCIDRNIKAARRNKDHSFAYILLHPLLGPVWRLLKLPGSGVVVFGISEKFTSFQPSYS